MRKSKTKILILIIAVAVLIFFFKSTVVFAITAQECLDKSVSDLSPGDQDWCYNIGIPQLVGPIQSANEKNRQNLNDLQSQVSALTKKINSFLDQIKKNQAEINQREEELAYTKEIFDQKAREQYTFLRLYDPITPFIFADSASQAFQEISFRQRAADADRKSLNQYAQDLLKLKEDKDSLQKSKDSLTAAQKIVSDKANFLAGQVAQADAYLATLSSKQQSFLAARLASLNIPLYALSGGGCSSDLTNGKDPGFGRGFGLFTFGVPNRVGLNQYGAWGRAKAGKSDDEILRAYYTFDGYQNFNATIRVNDCQGSNCINRGNIIWSGSLDDYVKRIYEAPDSWTDNGLAALKAQVIAARSYALAATNNGAMSICATQYCQVFQTSPKGGNWEAAVNATPGKAMVQGGSPIKAFFSSTHGGYVFSTGDLVGWSPTLYTKRAIDTPSGSVSSLGDLRGNAYDKDSPWFYCDWGGRKDYGNTAWLKPDELADIVNVILLAKQDGSSQLHLCQTDKPPNSDYGCSDTWNADTVRAKLGGAAYSTIDSISLNFDFGSGKTTNVSVSGSGHSNSFSGNEFKDYFNLRAPANIQIVGPLYNIETR